MRGLLLTLAILGSSSVLPAQNWTSWKKDSVFPGIETRERCTGFNEFANRYLWDVQLRSAYHRNVDLSWSAEPQLMRGAEAEPGGALAVKPGEVVGGRHTAATPCSTSLFVRVDDVKDAGAPLTAAARASSARPAIGGHWSSKDPEPLRKDLDVQVSGNTVTGTWTSPNFSFQVTAPLPEHLAGSVSVDRGADQKTNAH
jgi:hypothetical protein